MNTLGNKTSYMKTLLEDTVVVLEMLIIEYKNGNINYNDIIKHSRIKIPFLKEHMAQFLDLRYIKRANKIIEAHERIIVKSA